MLLRSPNSLLLILEYTVGGGDLQDYNVVCMSLTTHLSVHLAIIVTAGVSRTFKLAI